MSTYEEREESSAFTIEHIDTLNALDILDTIEDQEDEKYWVAEWTIRHGGTFARGIGIALAHADPFNTHKIKFTWPKIWEEALKYTETRRKNKDYY